MSDQKSRFEHLVEAPADPIMGLQEQFRQDPREEKVNLGIGLYKDEEGKSFLFPSVRDALQRLYERGYAKDYLPIDGDKGFIEETLLLSFSKELVESKPLIGFQTPGGTGALRIAAEFLSSEVKGKVYISDPTWPNHRPIFERAGFKVESYPYYKGQLLFDEMKRALAAVTSDDIVIFHACCHNPSGEDLSLEQWQEISDIIKACGALPLFDMAYQGFAEDPYKDPQAVQLFLREGHELFLCSSYSKSFGLYGERVGLLAASLSKPKEAASQIRAQIRALYSNPPLHGAQIIKEILQNAALKKQWEADLATIRKRIETMRKSFVEMIGKSDLAYITDGKGMFSFLPLTPDQVLSLQKEAGIYMPKSGRISFCSLNQANLSYVTKSIGRHL